MAAVEGECIGIDFGTSCCCVGVWQNNRVEIIPNDEGNRTTPSYVAFTETGVVVGEAARTLQAINASHTVSGTKSLLGRTFDDPAVLADIKYWPFSVVESTDQKPNVRVHESGEDKLLAPEEIAAMLLVKMKEIAGAYIGKEVKNAVLTVPNLFNRSQRQALRDAGVIAGLNVMRVLNESSAAAIAYGLDKKGLEHKVLFYNLGSRTLNVSLVTVEEGIIEVNAVAGDSNLGGDLFEVCMAEHFIREFKRKFCKDLTSDKRAVCRLRTACERAKRTLSSCTQADIHIDSLYEGINFDSTITRARFEDMNVYNFRKCMEPIEKVLRDAKIHKRQVHEVVLSGGSTRTPMIQSLLSDFFDGKELCKGINPDEAVASGAAVLAAILSGHHLGSNRLDDFLLQDVTAISVGVETAEGEMTTCIKRNTCVPARRTQTFSTEIDNMTTKTFKIYEGERAGTCDNNLLGEMTLADIPPMLSGQPQFDVTFDIDANNDLTVCALDKSTGKTSSIILAGSNVGLKPAELERMIDDAERRKVASTVLKQRLQARQYLEAYCNNIINTTMDEQTLAGQLSTGDKVVLNNKLLETLAWLGADQNAYAVQEEFEAKQKQLEFLVSIYMHKTVCVESVARALARIHIPS